ncbi:MULTISPECIES: hypothetical protein [Chlorobium]|uniref:Uncharacterized protein n=1 Tax=Chlorobium ferrooxidans DSM 13031 TaxID=377431 RepID=Q0YTL7_9CHLB|nr:MULTISPECIES: hypothetical protein [Chlorobium]EAT59649.1 conserved hypothetical protein [Chlorobium ferrooxidans DSM 13031]
MEETVKYTTLYAPVLFFVSGVFIVMLLNKFIGKQQSDKKTK